MRCKGGQNSKNGENQAYSQRTSLQENQQGGSSKSIVVFTKYGNLCALRERKLTPISLCLSVFIRGYPW